jgi:hypothetical protein
LTIFHVYFSLGHHPPLTRNDKQLETVTNMTGGDFDTGYRCSQMP